MKIRITGTEEENKVAAANIDMTFNVLEVSKFYPNRGESKLGRTYIECELPNRFRYGLACDLVKDCIDFNPSLLTTLHNQICNGIIEFEFYTDADKGWLVVSGDYDKNNECEIVADMILEKDHREILSTYSKIDEIVDVKFNVDLGEIVVCRKDINKQISF